MPATSTRQFKVGDRVAFKAAFLRSIGDYSHASASMRGTIVGFPYGETLASIHWDGSAESGGVVHVSALWPADRLHLEPN